MGKKNESKRAGRPLQYPWPSLKKKGPAVRLKRKSVESAKTFSNRVNVSLRGHEKTTGKKFTYKVIDASTIEVRRVA
jgi:hypothetical protein